MAREGRAGNSRGGSVAGGAVWGGVWGISVGADRWGKSDVPSRQTRDLGSRVPFSQGPRPGGTPPPELSRDGKPLARLAA